MIVHTFRRVAVALGLLGLVVSACAGNTGAPAQPAGAAPAGALPAAAKPQPYELLKVVLNNSGTGTLDVVNANHTKATVYAQMWGDFLVYVDPVSLAVKPGLAKEFSVNATGNEYTFKLRDDVKFHDGTPFNAEAVKFNFDRIGAAKIGLSYVALGGSRYSSTTVVDPFTVKVTFSEPYWTFYDHAALRLWFDSPAAVAKNGKDYGTKVVVGTGPYRVLEWVPNDHVFLERNDDYKWGSPVHKIQGPGYAKRIEIRGIVEGATRRATLESGQADVVMLDETDVPDIQKDARFKVELQPKGGTVRQLQINQKKFPFNDIVVRQAVGHAIDRDALVKTPRYSGIAQVALGIQGLKNMGGKWPEDLKSVQYAFDPAKARKLLDDAGYKLNGNVREKAGQKLQIEIIFPTGILAEAQPLQAMLADVGIQAKLTELQTAKWFDAFQKGEMHMTLGSNSGVGIDMFVSSFHTKGVENWWGVADPALDAILARVDTAPDPKVRFDASVAAQKLIVAQAYTLPLVDVFYPFGMKKTVSDIHYPPFAWPNFYQTWFAQ